MFCFQLQSSFTTREGGGRGGFLFFSSKCGITLWKVRALLLYTSPYICFYSVIFLIHTQSVILKQNRPQHPDVYVHYLESDWLNRALGLLHCRGETHHETTPVCTSHTVAMEKINTDGFRARLWSYTCNVSWPLCIFHMILFISHPREEKSRWLTGLMRANFSHFVRPWEPGMQWCSTGFFFSFSFF